MKELKNFEILLLQEKLVDRHNTETGMKFKVSRVPVPAGIYTGTPAVLESPSTTIWQLLLKFLVDLIAIYGSTSTGITIKGWQVAKHLKCAVLVIKTLYRIYEFLKSK